jgi:hypothetical protein
MVWGTLELTYLSYDRRRGYRGHGGSLCDGKWVGLVFGVKDRLDLLVQQGEE